MYDFSTFPVLETPRLLLREIAFSDARDLLQIRGDYRVTRYNTVRMLRSLDESIDLIDRTRLAYGDRRRIDWAITLKDNPGAGMIARIGFNYWLHEDSRASVGYDVAFAYWRRGIATEAARAVADFGFSQIDLRQIDADAYRENVASQRVLEKVGFVKTGVEREWEYGVRREFILYALTYPHWKKSREMRDER